MLSSTSRSIVNGNLLRRFLNQRVNIMVNIEDIDSIGTTLTGKTTDNQSIQVCLSEPVTSPINGWVEIIGVPTGSDRINCEEVILFEERDGDEGFDTDSYDMLVQFLNNCEDVFKSG
ncbi:uncharacterized protein LOC119077018 [Bradysia coprophila]|uniref:uncharacterized protein LOC119077018 n=1 Tax=Bradysia coprophila TaxID=38358 RepID=UPI00187DC172|nr:uncharacterized protein LOC119077018 [Bradysia coprophila]